MQQCSNVAMQQNGIPHSFAERLRRLQRISLADALCEWTIYIF